MIISLEDLGLAYRKAKVDLYYSSHVSLEAIAEYEESLHTNLTVLQGKIQGDDESWVEENEFTGNWFLASKSVDMTCWEQQRDPQANGLIFSSPAEKWTYACNSMAEKSEQKNQSRVSSNGSMQPGFSCSLDSLDVESRASF